MSKQSFQGEPDIDWLQEAKQRLDEWGREERSQRSRLGFHHETLEYVAMRYGGNAAKSQGKREQDNPRAVETDFLVSGLAKHGAHGEKKRIALYIYYVYRRTYGQGAKLMHCSRSYFQSLVESGQDVVAGGLMMHSANTGNKYAA